MTRSLDHLRYGGAILIMIAVGAYAIVMMLTAEQQLVVPEGGGVSDQLAEHAVTSVDPGPSRRQQVGVDNATDPIESEINSISEIGGVCYRNDRSPLAGVHVSAFLLQSEDATLYLPRLNRATSSIRERSLKLAGVSDAEEQAQVFVRLVLELLNKWGDAKSLGTARSRQDGGFNIRTPMHRLESNYRIYVISLPPAAYCSVPAMRIYSSRRDLEFTFPHSCSVAGSLSAGIKGGVLLALRFDGAEGRVEKWVSLSCGTDGRYEKSQLQPGKWKILAINGARVASSRWVNLTDGNTRYVSPITESTPSALVIAFTGGGGALVKTRVRVELFYKSVESPRDAGAWLPWEWEIAKSVHYTREPLTIPLLLPGRYRVQVTPLGKSGSRVKASSNLVEIRGGRALMNVVTSPGYDDTQLVLDVVDSNNAPIVGAKVILSCPDLAGDFVLFDRTDMAGQVRIPAVPIGQDLHVSLSANGNRRKRVVFSIPKMKIGHRLSYGKKFKL